MGDLANQPTPSQGTNHETPPTDPLSELAPAQIAKRSALPEPTWDIGESLKVVNGLIGELAQQLQVQPIHKISAEQITVLPTDRWNEQWYANSVTRLGEDGATPQIEIKEQRGAFTRLYFALAANIESQIGADIHYEAIDTYGADRVNAYPADKECSEFIRRKSKELRRGSESLLEVGTQKVFEDTEELACALQRELLLRQTLHATFPGLQRTCEYDANLKMFESLNEAVTEKLTSELLDSPTDIRLGKILEEYGIWDKSVDDYFVKSYRNDIALLEKIIQKIAQQRDTAAEQVWHDIKLAYCTGSTSIIDELSKVLGKGLSTIYAHLEAAATGAVQSVSEYLDAEPGEARDTLLRYLLECMPESQRETVRECFRNQ